MICMEDLREHTQLIVAVITSLTLQLLDFRLYASQHETDVASCLFLLAAMTGLTTALAKYGKDTNNLWQKVTQLLALLLICETLKHFVWETLTDYIATDLEILLASSYGQSIHDFSPNIYRFLNKDFIFFLKITVSSLAAFVALNYSEMSYLFFPWKRMDVDMFGLECREFYYQHFDRPSRTLDSNHELGSLTLADLPPIPQPDLLHLLSNRSEDSDRLRSRNKRRARR